MREVVSAISIDVGRRMTDRQWLRAIGIYHKDEMGREHRGRTRGGARQLSQVIEELTKENPDRFAGLLLQFPNATHHLYFHAVLRGLGEAGASTETITKVVRHCRSLPQRIPGRWLDQPLQKLPDRPWPADVLDFLIWVATSDPDPSEEMWRKKADGGDCYYGGDAYSDGINTARGSAASTIAALLFARPERTSHFLAALSQMVRDPSLAVRSCVAGALTAALNVDRLGAIDLFRVLVDTEDEILATPRVDRFLYYAVQSHFVHVSDIVERMIASPLGDVRKIGGRLACLAALGDDAARRLADRCMTGDAQLRFGAAQVYAANVGRPGLRDACRTQLIRLFNDAEEEVRAEATRCFWDLEGNQLEGCADLIRAFCRSIAFNEHGDDLLQSLKKTTAHTPSMVVGVAKRVLSLLHLSDAEGHVGGTVDTSVVIEIVLRAYAQSDDSRFRSRCLDIVDELAYLQAYGLRDSLAALDR